MSAKQLRQEIAACKAEIKNGGNEAKLEMIEELLPRQQQKSRNEPKCQ